MEQSTAGNGPRPSGLPRLSRLPVPRAGVRLSPSRESLQQRSKISSVNPQLRSTQSRDHLSTSNSTIPRVSTPSSSRDSTPVPPLDRDGAIDIIVYTPREKQNLSNPRNDILFRKPSKPYIREPTRTPPSSGEEEEVLQENAQFEAEGFEEQRSLSKRDGPRESRPSLSERTMETLQNVPPSPAVKNRGSTFFNSDCPMRSSCRPSSVFPTDLSMRPPSRTLSSRPSSSSGQAHAIQPEFIASANTSNSLTSTAQAHTAGKRQISTNSLKPTSGIRGSTAPVSIRSTSTLPSPSFSASPRLPSPSPGKITRKIQAVQSGSQTVSTRSLKPRSSVNGLFRKPSQPALNQSLELDKSSFVPKKKSASLSNRSSETTSTTLKTSKATRSTSTSGDDQNTTPRKSSLALRDQIAKAKAAKRAADKQVTGTTFSNEEEVPIIATGSFDFGLSNDPFNQNPSQDGSKGLLQKRIVAARNDGRLNIAAMGFQAIPAEVLNMYSLEFIDAHGGSWAESVDLTRFIAADNQLERLHDDVFPDIDPHATMDDEDAKGNQFGGLQSLDLHGNILIALPVGLRRLELLTSLNLANNKLGNECFQVVSQITSLQDLKMSGNALSGALDAGIANLINLEVLDIKHNALSSLPGEFGDLVHLRLLNITENCFTTLPFEILRQVPLIELLAAKNDLGGVLIAADIDELPQLQVLDITGNSLTNLTTSSQLRLPALHQLSCSFNRFTSLPDMTSWISLLTLAAEDNNIECIPEGFVILPNLKNVDFTGNNLKVLDDRIGKMDSLDIFRINGNPLREKKFAGMTTEDLKRALKSRMAPVEHDVERDMDADGAFYSAPASPISTNRPPSSEWPVKPGGILDRSNTQSYSLNPVAAAHIAANNTVRILELHRNAFKEIPSAIAFFAGTLTTLSLAHNELNSDTFIKDDLELPVLMELNLSSNTFNSLQPLIRCLHASLLEKLDISFNRLTSLPALKQHFPSLTTLLASNNTIRELPPESVRGLKVLDCSSNDINALNPRIGLLGGPGGLERLDVSGNRFRVPKYTVLEKGTEATLAWLRDRLPAGEPSLVSIG